MPLFVAIFLAAVSSMRTSLLRIYSNYDKFNVSKGLFMLLCPRLARKVETSLVHTKKEFGCFLEFGKVIQ